VTSAWHANSHVTSDKQTSDN